ncbi:hypothetical protein CYU10_001268 [Lactococcus lactis subsp. lactis]|uniref:Uncharacterized protein n=1 Tax=Lactococcus lactis subsp. lactis TaxID=1360 RepID=A0A2R7Y094_LACLL|nr:hypothetical protein CYU10_001268 [Lactococcus lactis subsp. lactis]
MTSVLGVDIDILLSVAFPDAVGSPTLFNSSRYLSILMTLLISIVLEEFFVIGTVVSLVVFPSMEVLSEMSYLGVSTTIFPLFSDAFAFISTIPSSLVV